MTFLNFIDFKTKIHPHHTIKVLDKVYPEIIKENDLFCLIVFSSLSTDKFRDNSDLDLILLYNTEVDNR